MNEGTVQLKEAKTLPDGWRWFKLGDIAKPDTTQVLPETPEAGQLPYVGLEHVESETGRITGTLSGKNTASAQGTAFHFDSRHVLYGKLRPYLNKVALPDFEGRCSTELLPLLPVSECYRSYLAWLLRHSEIVTEATRLMMGTRMPRADMDELFKLPVPLPPLPEQKRIAARIQELMAEVEHARTACEAQLEAAKALPQAYLRQVFESEEAKRWERRRLGEVCKGDSGVWGDPGDDSPSCFPILRSNNIQSGTMVLDDVAVIKITDTSVVDKKRLITGDILVTTSSGSKDLLGKSALFIQPPDGKEYLFSNFTMRLRSHEGIVEPTFLYFYLQSPTAKHTLTLLQDTTTGLRNLDRAEFLAQTVPIPPLAQQKRIATELRVKMEEAEKLKASIEKELETINALPQAILRKAFSGEL